MFTSKRKILALSAIRSDYNLLSRFYQKIHSQSEFDFSILVSGAHLSPSFGYTVDEIMNDGLPIFAKVTSLLSSDSRESRLKSASIFLSSCIDQVAAYRPDLIIYAGDREEVLIGAMLGAFLDIPTLHFFGGDHAEDGNVDNSIRHAASKLSSLHFVSTEQHALRLQALGELASRIFIVGSPAIDRYELEPRIDIAKILEKYGVKGWDDFAIVIFHPILGDEDHGGEYFYNLLESLKELRIPAFVSYPNVDSGNQQIIAAIERYGSERNFCFYKSLPSADFINLMRNARVLVGNSSCGLVEAPFIRLGAVNVGQRQAGRANAGNVIFCGTSQQEIAAAIKEALSEPFRNQVQSVPSPYGDGHATERAFELLRSLNWSEFLRKPADPLARHLS